MTTKNYYEILGVSKDATQEELKKKYRKLSLQYHPDRQQGKSEEEVAESEKKFKEVVEAYDILKDPEKRRHYDKYGTVDNHTVDIDEYIRQMAHGFGFGGMRSRPQVTKGKSVLGTAYMTIEELYNNSEITFKYKRHIPCKKCSGSGSKSGKIDQCPHCHGSGRILQQMAQHGGMMIYETTCPYCNGVGKLCNDPCDNCNGSGLEIVEETMKIKIPEGCSDGMFTIVEGAGSYPPNNDGVNGDLKVVFRLTDTQGYKIDPNNPYNLIKDIEVPVIDCITGCDFEFETVDKKKYKMNIKPNTLHNSMLRMTGKGLMTQYRTRGDIFICVKMKMPNNKLTKKEQNLLSELKECNNFK